VGGRQAVSSDRYKLPLEKYLRSIRKNLAYKNQREKAVDTVKKRENDARRIEELRQRQIAYESRQTRERERQSAQIGIYRRAADVRRSSSEYKCRREANMYKADTV
jgi:hypothetical protein